MTTATKTKKTVEKFIEGLGKRKDAVARVRLTPSKKTTWKVNDREVHVYFPTDELRRVAAAPLAMLEDLHFNISVQVKGGGIHGQADAVALGIARAIIKSDVGLRKTLKKENMLSRDARIKERRKFGLKKARKAPQWSKR